MLLLEILSYAVLAIVTIVVVVAFAIAIDLPGSICRAIDRYYENKEG